MSRVRRPPRGGRLHALIKASAPALLPRLWYGMPAYARDGKVVCFFRGADRFKERYMTLGFNDAARLDEGSLWPVAFALTDLTPAEEAVIGALVAEPICFYPLMDLVRLSQRFAFHTEVESALF